jgi:hypothetical protein
MRIRGGSRFEGIPDISSLWEESDRMAKRESHPEQPGNFVAGALGVGGSRGTRRADMGRTSR